MPNVVDRLGGASSSLSMKAPCRVATTAAITLSGFQTIDGVLPTSSEHEDLRRILVKDQSSAATNGIYIMSSGAWERAKDFDGSNDFRQGTWVFVYGGSTQSGAWRVTSTVNPSSFEIDTTSISFTSVADTDFPLLTESAPTLGADLNANGHGITNLTTLGSTGQTLSLGTDLNANNKTISSAVISLSSDLNANGRGITNLTTIGSTGQTLSLGNNLSAGSRYIDFADDFGIRDANQNKQLMFNVGSTAAKNFVRVTNASSGNPAVLDVDSATDTNVKLQVVGKGNLGAEIKGTGTNDSASAGYVGEIVESTVLSSNAVSVSGTVNITSIGLTAGHWRVWGTLGLTAQSSTILTLVIHAINSVSITLPTAPNGGAYVLDRGLSTAGITGVTSPYVGNTGQLHVQLGSSATYYLVTNCNFSAGTLTGYGYLAAQRIR